jgi:hypothetical protein
MYVTTLHSFSYVRCVYYIPSHGKTKPYIVCFIYARERALSRPPSQNPLPHTRTALSDRVSNPISHPPLPPSTSLSASNYTHTSRQPLLSLWRLLPSHTNISPRYSYLSRNTHLTASSSFLIALPSSTHPPHTLILLPTDCWKR